jgi:hypothetical protein
VDADAAHDFMKPLFTLFSLNEDLIQALGNTSKDILNDVGIKMMRIPGRMVVSSLHIIVFIVQS